MPDDLLRTDNLSLETLRARIVSGGVFAIMDACDAPTVPLKVGELGEERAVSLYRGMAEEEYSAFAPYLVRVDSALLDWIVATLWQEAWGIFVVADSTLPRLRSHFRHFLIVDDPQGEEMYFRFYDPRVLRKYLPTCTPKELRQFYGGIEAFVLGVPNNPAAVQSIAREEEGTNPTFGTASVVTRVGQRFPIREEQMAEFAPEAEAAFEGRLMEHLREYHTEAVKDLPDGMLLQVARTGISRARRYGMTWESNLTAFVALMFEIAYDWDEHPRMQMILNSSHIEPEKKLDVLMERTSEQTWDEVERRHDTASWH